MLPVLPLGFTACFVDGLAVVLGTDLLPAPVADCCALPAVDAAPVAWGSFGAGSAGLLAFEAAAFDFAVDFPRLAVTGPVDKSSSVNRVT